MYQKEVESKIVLHSRTRGAGHFLGPSPKIKTAFTNLKDSCGFGRDSKEIYSVGVSALEGILPCPCMTEKEPETDKVQVKCTKTGSYHSMLSVPVIKPSDQQHLGEEFI